MAHTVGLLVCFLKKKKTLTPRSNLFMFFGSLHTVIATTGTGRPTADTQRKRETTKGEGEGGGDCSENAHF